MGDRFYHVKNRENSRSRWVEYKGKVIDGNYVRLRFSVVVFVLAMVEFMLVIWPLLATILFRVHAAFTWIWFQYPFRFFFLFIVFAFESNVTKLVGAGGYRGCWNKFIICAAFRQNCSLYFWCLIAVLFGIIGGVINLIVGTIVAPFVFGVGVDYILTVIFNVLFPVESFLAILFVYYCGIYLPHAHAPERNTSYYV